MKTIYTVTTADIDTSYQYLMVMSADCAAISLEELQQTLRMLRGEDETFKTEVPSIEQLAQANLTNLTWKDEETQLVFLIRMVKLVELN